MERELTEKKIIILSFLAFFIFILFIFKINFYPQKSISEYYSILRHQEKTLNNELISEKELNILKACGKNQKYFKNMSTCGSGYSHGLMEAAVKNISDKDTLVEKFKNICNDQEIRKIKGDYCSHGLGHATFIQTNYNLIDVSYQDIQSMCMQKVLTNSQQILCLAIFANRMALSIEGVKNQVYYKLAEDICKNLPILEQYRCTDLLVNKPQELYMITEKDLSI